MRVNVTKSKAVEVATFGEASREITAHWGSKSSTAFYRDPKAGIIEVDGQPVAHVSYNGRVWKGTDRMKTGGTEIAREGCGSSGPG